MIKLKLTEENSHEIGYFYRMPEHISAIATGYLKLPKKMKIENFLKIFPSINQIMLFTEPEPQHRRLIEDNITEGCFREKSNSYIYEFAGNLKRFHEEYNRRIKD